MKAKVLTEARQLCAAVILTLVQFFLKAPRTDETYECSQHLKLGMRLVTDLCLLLARQRQLEQQ